MKSQASDRAVHHGLPSSLGPLLRGFSMTLHTRHAQGLYPPSLSPSSSGAVA